MFSSSNNSMKYLCEHLKKDGYLKSQKVYDALMSVDRADFSPERPYADSPQPIKYNVTISAPHMHAYCLELLRSFKSRRKSFRCRVRKWIFNSCHE